MSVVYVNPEAAEEKWQDKLVRKFKENPFVPIGMSRFARVTPPG